MDNATKIWLLWSKGPPYGERENRAWNEKRDKGFSLGGMQEEGESKVLLPSRRHKESMCKSKERGSYTRKKKKEERVAKRKPFKEKEDIQERAMRGEENKKERVKCYRLWKR